MAVDQIRHIIMGLDELTELSVKRVTLDVAANLMEGTPVDVGWARNNWVPSLSDPFIEDLAGVSRDQGAVDRARAQSDAGKAEVLGYRLQHGAVYITNNVPYIVSLNEGHSSQAPDGFVDAALERAVAGVV